MKLKKNGFIHHVAFMFARKEKVDGELQLPEKTSLCSLFWRFIFSLLLISVLVPIVIIAIVIVGSLVAAVLLVVIPIALLFGWYPVRQGYFERMPLPKIYGRRLWPITAISFAALVYFLKSIVKGGWYILGYWWRELASISKPHLHSSVFWSIIALAIAAIAYLLVRFFKSEVWDMVHAWLKAKLIDKVCPTVTFE